MNRRCITLSLLFCTTLAVAQKGPVDFGDISIAELDDKNYNDSAEAIILFDKGNVMVEPNSTAGTTFKRHLRIKILKKSAFDEWGNMKVLVRKNGMSRVNGACYNLVNGVVQKSELTESSIFKSKSTRYTEQVSFAFPSVREGSVIEISYTVTYEGLYLMDWRFQYSIPTRWSEYTIHSPVEGYTTHLRGTLQPTRHESKYNGKYQSWIMENVPAFKPEPSMPDEDAYRSSVEFSGQFNSWLGIYSHLIKKENFTGIIHHHSYLKETVNELTKGMSDARQRIKVISDYIKTQVRWNEEVDFYGDEPKEVLKRGYGTVADINLLLGSMLEKAGLTVNPVLLSTRRHGYILEAFPSMDQFNYVVCEIVLPDGELLVDATEKYLPYDLLPERCFNHKGFLITPKQYGWIGIEPLRNERVAIDANLRLTDTGGLSGKVTITQYGYAAFKARQNYFLAGEDKYKNDMLKSSLWSVTNAEIGGIKETEKAVSEKYEMTMETYATLTGDRIYLNPNIFLREEFNPYVLAERQYPIDFELPTEKVVMCTLLLPDGYEVDELPQSKASVVTGSVAKFAFSVSQSGNRITVVSRVQINKTLFQPDEYQGLKEFYDRLVAKKAESIILRKKT